MQEEEKEEKSMKENDSESERLKLRTHLSNKRGKTNPVLKHRVYFTACITMPRRFPLNEKISGKCRGDSPKREYLSRKREDINRHSSAV